MNRNERRRKKNERRQNKRKMRLEAVDRKSLSPATAAGMFRVDIDDVGEFKASPLDVAFTERESGWFWQTTASTPFGPFESRDTAENDYLLALARMKPNENDDACTEADSVFAALHPEAKLFVRKSIPDEHGLGGNKYVGVFCLGPGARGVLGMPIRDELKRQLDFVDRVVVHSLIDRATAVFVLARSLDRPPRMLFQMFSKLGSWDQEVYAVLAQHGLLDTTGPGLS